MLIKAVPPIWRAFFWFALRLLLGGLVFVPQVNAECYDVAGHLSSVWNDDLKTTHGVLSEGNFDAKWNYYEVETGQWFLTPSRFCKKMVLVDYFVGLDPEVASVAKGTCDNGSHTVTLFIGGLFNFDTKGKLGMKACYHCRFWGMVCDVPK